MNKNRVLIAEDEAPILHFLTKVVTGFGYEVTGVPNGAKALEEHQKNPFPVIVTDLNMPVMSGEELIDRIGSMENIPFPIIIVLTSLNDIKKVIEIMKKGVFDYQVKPANTADLAIKLKNASEVFELRRIQFVLEKEKELRLNEQLTWMRYKENLKERDLDKYKNNLIYHMKHNLGQGGGFGALLSLLRLMYMTAEQKEDSFVISGELMGLIKENSALLEKTFGVMEKISDLTENPLNTERVSVSELYDMLEELIRRNSKYISINGNTAVISDRKQNYSEFFLNINREAFISVLDELIKNSCKFSEKNSQIFFLFSIRNGVFVLSLLNEPSSLIDVKGIPLEYSNLVFEPFYRIPKFIDDRYDTMNIGMGLPLVKSTVKKHGGNVSIFNIKDFTAKNADNLKVNMEIEIPVVE
ncbi:MAG TPA: response regulator [Leptospiraceae bacterium]|nr:response regulator [Leptospiraceae bacterium]